MRRDAQIVQTEIRKPGARHDPRANLGDGHAGRLGNERHGARSARVHLQDVYHIVLDRVLHVHQSDHAERLRHGLGLGLQFGDGGGGKRVGWQRAGAVAGMDAGFLDMLHDAGDIDGLAVGDAVHIDLDRVVQVAVDQHRPTGQIAPCDAHRLEHVAMQSDTVIDDLHGTTAKHVTGADHHGIADAVGDGFGFLDRPRNAVLRLAQAKAMQQQLKSFAVLGDVDRIGAGSEDRNLLAFQRLRELQGRLSAVLHDAAEQRAAAFLTADQRDNIFGR